MQMLCDAWVEDCSLHLCCAMSHPVTVSCMNKYSQMRTYSLIVLWVKLKRLLGLIWLIQGGVVDRLYHFRKHWEHGVCAIAIFMLTECETVK